VHEQQIGTSVVDYVFNTRFQPLEHPEKREGDAHLQKDQYGASGVAPDPGPDER
jgi:hypothetical protein